MPFNQHMEEKNEATNLKAYDLYNYKVLIFLLSCCVFITAGHMFNTALLSSRVICKVSWVGLCVCGVVSENLHLDRESNHFTG